MKWGKTAIVLLLLGLLSIGSAWADSRSYRYHSGGHSHSHGYRGSFGVYIGPYWGWGPWNYAPGYYPPYYPPVVIERTPPVYIEQQPVDVLPAPSVQASYWYYCHAAKGYYPYVRECPEGWQRVSPKPPNSP